MNSFSNCSKDFPLVSGKIFNKIKNPTNATNPNMKKVSAFPKLDNSQGKTCCTIQLINELINPINPMAKPLYLIGYNSDNKTHITGPREKAKQATNPRIPINTSEAFILVAASKIAPSFLEYSLFPSAAFISLLKSTSFEYVLLAKGCSLFESILSSEAIS